MKSSTKLTSLFLSFGSFLTIESSTAFNCPPLTGDQISQVCFTKQAQRLGMEAGEVVVEGVRFINQHNCGTGTAILAKFKTGHEKIPGEFIEEERDIQSDNRNVKISGRCVYKSPKLFTGSQDISLHVMAQQKLLGGVQVNPVVTTHQPKIGEEKVVNPDALKKKPTVVESVKGIFHHKKEEKEKEPTAPAYEGELEEKLEGKAPQVVHNAPGAPQIREGYLDEQRHLAPPRPKAGYYPPRPQELPPVPPAARPVPPRPTATYIPAPEELDEPSTTPQYTPSSSPPKKAPPPAPSIPSHAVPRSALGPKPIAPRSAHPPSEYVAMPARDADSPYQPNPELESRPVPPQPTATYEPAPEELEESSTTPQYTQSSSPPRKAPPPVPTDFELKMKRQRELAERAAAQ